MTKYSCDSKLVINHFKSGISNNKEELPQNFIDFINNVDSKKKNIIRWKNT